MIDALAMIETVGFIPAIAAADSALKAADVHIVPLAKVDGGIVTLFLRGDVSAVRSAADAGAQTAKTLGSLRAVHVIARLHQQVETLFSPDSPPQKQRLAVAIQEDKPAETAESDAWLVAVPPPNKRTNRKRAAET